MISTVKQWRNIEVRGAMAFLHVKDEHATEVTLNLLLYGEHVISRKQLSLWCSSFQEKKKESERQAT